MYSPEAYLNMLKLAKRSPHTIRYYRVVLGVYARFLGVEPGDLHHHLTTDNLMRFAGSLAMSARGTKTYLAVLHRYYAINGVTFDELEQNALRPRVTELHHDKPLDLTTLQKMMDVADTHGKALISVLISTGMRIGECSQLLLSDVDGDTITIPGPIAKNGKGGKVYLTSEAQEFLSLWLKDRSKYIKRADAWSKNFRQPGAIRTDYDERVFACSETTIYLIFMRLYRRVDGERGKYGYRCTPHSCRRYFRSHAGESGMSLDLVEYLMRHTGYLTESYVRISDAEARHQFHAGESALYITRADHRTTTGELENLKRERDEQDKKIDEMMMKQIAFDIALKELKKETLIKGK
jgi:integrase